MTRTRIEHVLGAAGVGAQRSERIVDDVTHADRCREMEDLVGRLDLLVDEVGIEDRSLDEPSPAVEVRGAAGGEVVEHRHLCALVAERIDDVRSDEAGASRHEHAHDRQGRAPAGLALDHEMPPLPCCLVPDRIRVLRVIARMNVGGPARIVADLMDYLDPERFEQRLLTGRVADDEADELELGPAPSRTSASTGSVARPTPSPTPRRSPR